MLLSVHPAQAAMHDTFKALLFTKAAGYVHGSIPAGIQMVRELAAANHFAVEQTDDPSVFNDTKLAEFDVLVMMNTSGMVWTSDEQRAALQKYVRSGKGVVAVHNALDMEIENQFPWWDELINAGSHMPGHSPGIFPGTAKVADRAHPSTKNLPRVWQRSEEWYNFAPNNRGQVHVLVTADETTYTPGPNAMGADHPISWCRKAEGGRVWATAMGHETSAYAEPFFREHVRGGIAWAAGAEEGDCGGTVSGSFEKVTLDDNTADPMELDVAKDGRVFYVQRQGAVKIYKPDTHTTVTAAQLAVYTGGEDGLVGMELDPNFSENSWIYLYWSPANSTTDVNRLSRFTVTGDTIDPASEKKILEVPAYRDRTYPEPGHTGGAVEFGPDGTLYLSTGDDTPPNLSPDWQGYSPIDWRPGQQMLDSARTAGSTNDLRGKILRIKPKADGTYDIPAGNLYPPGTAKTRPEIFAMGFRNPFRFTVDQKTGWVHLSDYGPDRGGPTTERGPEGLVEYNIIKTAGNYGWPFCHGDNQPYAPYNPDTKVVGPKFDCDHPVNDSPNNTGLTELKPIQKPVMWYGYGTSPQFPELGSGGAAPMTGPVYRYDAANPSETKFPAYFDGVNFFYEWARHYVKEIHPNDDSTGVLKINPFLGTFLKPMDMTFGPDGSMYLLEWGTSFGGGNNDSGLYRIDYSAGARSPVAKGTASATDGPAPLAVTFDGSASYDPDGDPITFAWDFDGDGTFDSTEAKPSHTYPKGKYTAQLKVTDTTGKSGFSNIEIVSGNSRPVVTIETPINGTPIEFGQDVPYKVTVTDPDGGTIDCTKVIVAPALGHDDHEHETTQIPGCEGTLNTGDLGGHPAGANLYYVINAHYTDGGDDPLTGYGKAVLQPHRKQGEYFTKQSGVRVIDEGGAESGKRIGDISDNDWIAFTPMDLSTVTAVAYRLSSPTGGGSIELRADSPTGTLLATTQVPSTGGWNNYQMTASVPVRTGVRSTSVYAVFKNSANNAFDLDAVQFGGDAVPGEDLEAGTYTVTAQHSGKNIAPLSLLDDALIVQRTATTGAEQRWQVLPLSSGGFQLKNEASGRCLDVPGGSTTPEVQLVQWSCHPDGAADQRNQRFHAAKVGDVWKVTSGVSGLCLDVKYVSQADDAAIIQWNCVDAANQRFGFTKVSGDRTPPVTTATGASDGWHTGPVEITLAAEDDASEVAATEYRLDGGAWTTYLAPFPVSGDGERKLEFRSRDGAGNQEEAKALTVRIDATAPQTAAAFAPPGDSGWHGSAVPVVLTATDALSGVGRVEYALDGGAWTAYGEPVVVSGEGAHELRYRSVDKAGVEEQVKAATLKIDGTRPTLLVAGVADGATYGDAQDLRISWQAVDATSGVKLESGTIDGGALQDDAVLPLFTLSLARHEVVVSAQDNAGNTTSSTIGFTVATSMTDLQRLVDRFAATSWITPAEHDRLTKELAKAGKAVAKGQEAKAVRLVDSFKAQAATLTRDDVRQVLLRDADRVIEALR
ncbi:ThuA domain-containing protein [Nonomuraea sp. NBC_01738]|uniref:ThuA domain-containing protein n=1 Tax=Nonomuraea sp. NBC_01738 TaxID=2976003 RepID=UPI002E0FEC19|nr:ThuA domain-containing protein [Nonomuraea sp. NBC_01738]